ncbi:MAG: nicotinate-nucleotide adenylyltransferase [Sedimentisphaerales bacterium]|nr:nicotinate-nucleotide adenylyltransferase [Sedimentisphaerales bacterium]
MAEELSINQGILLFGGTFDPIHNGHLIIARGAAEELEVQKVILVPAAQPPHKQGQCIAPIKDRLNMAVLATQDEKIFEVSNCEAKRNGPSYSIDTVRHFKTIYPDVPLYWLIGADSITELASWYKIGELVEECTIVTAGRKGYSSEGLSLLANILNQDQITRLKEHVLDTPSVEISATLIRQRVLMDLSIKYLVPDEVADYISIHILYEK